MASGPFQPFTAGKFIPQYIFLPCTNFVFSDMIKKANEMKCIARVKPYTIKELCCFYEIGNKTFKKWLLPFQPEIGSKNGRYYSVLQVEIIFEKLGVPYEIN